MGQINKASSKASSVTGSISFSDILGGNATEINSKLVITTHKVFQNFESQIKVNQSVESKSSLNHFIWIRKRGFIYLQTFQAILRDDTSKTKAFVEIIEKCKNLF